MAEQVLQHFYRLKGGEQEAVERNNPLLERREPLVVYCDDGVTRLKIGDGEKRYDELDWVKGPDNVEVSEHYEEMPEEAIIQIITDDVDEEELLKNAFTEYIDEEIDRVVYIGDSSSMPEYAKVQFILGDTDETELIENEFKNYIDYELTKAKNSGEFKGDPGSVGNGISSATINSSGELVLSYTNGSSVNLGKVVGATGAKGNPGTNGHTPVRGEDYWTTADQQAMVEAVLNALPIGEEAVF